MAKQGGKSFRKAASNAEKLKAAEKEQLSEQNIARFGLKNAAEVRALEKTAEGKVSQALINEKIAELQKEDAMQRFAIEELLEEQRNLISLKLGLLFDKEKAEKHMSHELALIDINKRLSPEKPPVKIDTAADKALIKALEDTVKQYDKSLEEIGKEIKEAEKELKDTLDAIDKKYEALKGYDKQAALIEDLFDLKDDVSDNQPLQSDHEQSLFDGMSSFLSSFEKFSDNEGDDELSKAVRSVRETSKEDLQKGLDALRKMKPDFDKHRDNFLNKRAEELRKLHDETRKLMGAARHFEARLDHLRSQKDSLLEARDKTQDQLNSVKAKVAAQSTSRYGKIDAARNATLKFVNDLGPFGDTPNDAKETSHDKRSDDRSEYGNN